MIKAIKRFFFPIYLIFALICLHSATKKKKKEEKSLKQNVTFHNFSMLYFSPQSLTCFKRCNLILPELQDLPQRSLGKWEGRKCTDRRTGVDGKVHKQLGCITPLSNNTWQWRNSTVPDTPHQQGWERLSGCLRRTSNQLETGS